MLSECVSSLVKLCSYQVTRNYSTHAAGVRCEFDETERWVKLYEREAVILRQKVLDRDADAAQGASKWSGGSIGASESQRPESEVSTKHDNLYAWQALMHGKH